MRRDAGAPSSCSTSSRGAAVAGGGHAQRIEHALVDLAIEEVAGAREHHVADHAEGDVLVAVAFAHATGHVHFIQFAHQLLVGDVTLEHVVVGIARQAKSLAHDVADRGLRRRPACP